jgi:type IV pilus assembly protein PilB
MAKEPKRIGDLLIERGLLTPEGLARAIDEQKKTGSMLGSVIVRLKLVSERDLLECLHQQLGLPLVDLENTAPDEAALGTIREDVARKYDAIPIEVQQRKNLVVAMADPLNVAALEDLRFLTGMFIRPVLASPTQIRDAIERYYHIDSSMNEVIQSIVSSEDEIVVNAVQETEDRKAIDELLKEAEGRPIVRLANWLLRRAVETRASDIHIEPQNHQLVVRFRVDGMLREEQRLPKWTQGAIVSRLKVLSNLDIAEKRLPQDGRLTAEIAGRRVDMRVSTLPLTTGEKIVMRIVDHSRSNVELAALGLSERDHKRISGFLSRPQGIILVTGPTGSGKSTLLYAGLRHIMDVTRNITTVEDPVENNIAGINQVQVDEKAKKTFANALRAILRQDPDVIMIGEIRDRETAQIAFRASVTGHLVLSTVHTNDAAGAVTRLIDLGLEPFMVATSLVGVISMRLVRTICPRCKESYEGDAAQLNALSGAVNGEQGAVKLWRGKGCPSCANTGYSGRTGIYELLAIDDNIRSLISRGAPDHEIKTAATDAGMLTIGEDALAKVLDGRTTLDEVTRVVYLAEQGVKVCESCSIVISQEFDYCPSCGHFVGEHCEQCRRRTDGAWKFCPSCGHKKPRPGEPAAEPRLRPVPAGKRRAS